jgi:hypothetical protein
MQRSSRVELFTARTWMATLAALGLAVGVLGSAPTAAAAPGSQPPGELPSAQICLIQVCRPDLKVAKEEVGYDSYGFDPTQAVVHVKITVTNAGNANAGPFSVAIFGWNSLLPAPNTPGGIPLQNFAVSGLKSGASQTLFYYPPVCPVRTAQIIVDTTNAVLESNEANNGIAAAHVFQYYCLYSDWS